MSLFYSVGLFDITILIVMALLIWASWDLSPSKRKCRIDRLQSHWRKGFGGKGLQKPCFPGRLISSLSWKTLS